MSEHTGVWPQASARRDSSRRTGAAVRSAAGSRVKGVRGRREAAGPFPRDLAREPWQVTGGAAPSQDKARWV